MTACCYEPSGRRVVPQTPLATERELISSLSTSKYLFFPQQVAGLFQGLQIERYALQRSEAALRRVATFRPDWDRAGSLAPNPAAVSNASAVLPELYRACCATRVPWRSPHISANEEGEISFEWWEGDRKLTLYVGSDAMQVVKVWGVHLFDEMDVVTLQSAAEFGPLWTWLHER
jgi:hypothetical protein